MSVFTPSDAADLPASLPASLVEPRNSSAEQPTSVARLNSTIHDFVAKWSTVWVEGEITSWNIRAGHIFGRLKDAETDASISIRVWASVRSRIPADLAIGDRVVAAVKADYYPKGGDIGFIVSAMKHTGLGDQWEKIERLRVALRQEGLFDQARKKPLPFLPTVIGLITGEKSDAEKDVHRNAELRWPQVRFKTVHVAVQGERCVPDVLAALDQLEADPAVDVIIIARGGGDPQTLLGFSDERLLRRVAAMRVPVVSAIGHENDHPLLDDVADLRASTPTDAAKRVVPDVDEQRAIIEQLRSRTRMRLSQRISFEAAGLEQIRSRPIMRSWEPLLTNRAQDVFLLASRSRDAVSRLLDQALLKVTRDHSALTALSPRATLARGYAIVQQRSGAIVKQEQDAPAGTELTLTLTDGVLAARSEGPRDPA